MNFAHPQILWLLLVIPPALGFFFWWSWRERQRLATQFIQAKLLPGLIFGASPLRQKLRLWCLALAVMFVIIALARPQWGFSWVNVKQKGLDILVAIDTSKSMLAADIAPNRLTRAKLAAMDLMQQASSDRLGVVAFAGGAFLQCPLTIDDNAFRQSVEALNVDTIPQGGTALAEAIRTANRAFKDADNFKVLVIFTDGEDNDEGALAAAEEAAKDGMKIFTLGIGTPEGELLRVKDAKDRMDYIRDDQGNVVKSRLNETLLQQVAGAAEGAYYRLTGAKTIDSLYEQFLAPLPKSEGQERLIKQYHERYHWPLGAAILLLLLEMLLPERKRARASRSSAKSRVADSKKAVGAIAAFLVLAAMAHATPATALKAYQSGNYTNALAKYEQLLDEQLKAKKPEDPRLHFNAGTAAFCATNYDAAIRHFNSALTAGDIQLQAKAYYNLGNTHFRIGQAAEKLNALEESWKQAMKCYQNAVALDGGDKDAQFNLAFVEERLRQIQLMRELARRGKEAADAETQRRNYHGAREIMEQLVQSNIAAKPFEEFTQKLKQIDEIANPDQP